MLLIPGCKETLRFHFLSLWFQLLKHERSSDRYNWRLLTLLGAMPVLVLTFVAYAVIDESPRWTLVRKGEFSCKLLLKKVALRNGAGPLLATADRIRLRIPAPPKQGAGVDKAISLFCTLGFRLRLWVILLLWFASGFSYYGLTLGVSSLSGDRYINTAIMSTVELPAIVLLIPLVESPLGRKWGTLLLFCTLGACSIVAMIWTADFGRLFLNIIGRAASGELTVHAANIDFDAKAWP